MGRAAGAGPRCRHLPPLHLALLHLPPLHLALLHRIRPAPRDSVSDGESGARGAAATSALSCPRADAGLEVAGVLHTTLRSPSAHPSADSAPQRGSGNISRDGAGGMTRGPVRVTVNVPVEIIGNARG